MNEAADIARGRILLHAGVGPARTTLWTRERPGVDQVRGNHAWKHPHSTTGSERWEGLDLTHEE